MQKTMSYFYESMNKLTYLQQFILCLLTYLIFMEMVYVQWTPFYYVMQNNSDVLLIEDVARDLNRGGNLFNWRLTQAPYLFPDIFLARIITLFVSTVGATGYYYYLIFGILVIGLICFLCRILSIAVLPIALLSVALYFVAPLSLTNDDAISLYFGMIGHHAGINLLILLLFIFAVVYEKNPEKSYVLYLIFAFSFIGTVSDSLVAICVLIPYFFYLLAIRSADKNKFLASKRIFGFVFLGAVLAKIFSFTVPFPQDREYMAQVIDYLPYYFGLSIKEFCYDFYKYGLESHISMSILAFYLAAFVIGVRRIKMAAKSPSLFLAYFIVLIPPVIIMLQVFLGMYHGREESRQWAPVIYLAIVFGGMLYIEKRAENSEKLEQMVLFALILLCIYATIAFTKIKGTTAPDDLYKNFINCMRENHLPAGNMYAAGYWTSRPLQLYSNNEFIPIPLGLDMKAYTNAENVKMIRESSPRYLIVAYPVHYDDVLAKLGPATKEYCNMNMGMPYKQKSPARLLDYTGNQKALDYLKKVAKDAY